MAFPIDHHGDARHDHGVGRNGPFRLECPHSVLGRSHYIGGYGVSDHGDPLGRHTKVTGDVPLDLLRIGKDVSPERRQQSPSVESAELGVGDEHVFRASEP